MSGHLRTTASKFWRVIYSKHVTPCSKEYFYFNVGSSRPEVFCKKSVLRNFAKFTVKHLRQSLFFNKVAGPEHLLVTASVMSNILEFKIYGPRATFMNNFLKSLLINCRRQRQPLEVFWRISQISQEKTCDGISVLLKLQALNFIKKRLQHSCFPVKIRKFKRTLFLKNVCEQLLRRDILTTL